MGVISDPNPRSSSRATWRARCPPGQRFFRLFSRPAAGDSRARRGPRGRGRCRPRRARFFSSRGEGVHGGTTANWTFCKLRGLLIGDSVGSKPQHGTTLGRAWSWPSREIGQDLLRTGEGLFGIDDPFALAPRVGVFELAEIGEELQLVGGCMASRPCRNRCETGARAPGLEERSRSDRRFCARRPAIVRHPARCNAHADGAGGSCPKCAGQR